MLESDYWLSTTTIAVAGAKVELATVEEWTKAEKESILQESAKTNTKAGKFHYSCLPNWALSSSSLSS